MSYGNLGIRGLDYSAGAISGVAVKGAGYSFVVRYVEDPKVGLNAKHITPAEYRDLVASGVDVYLVHEVWTNDMLGGHDAGVDHARRARAGADWIGYPAGAPIFLACDMHLTAGQLPAALAYVDGAISVLGNDAVGVYGFWELVDTCIAQGKGRWFWQCGISPDAGDAVHIWQRNDTTAVRVCGIDCDVNELRIPINWQKGTDMAPVLKQGDGVRNPAVPAEQSRGRLHWFVESAQALLNIRGLSRNDLPVTGEFDAATAGLVKELQHRNNLPETGVVDAVTWGFLIGNDAPDWS